VGAPVARRRPCGARRPLLLELSEAAFGLGDDVLALEPVALGFLGVVHDHEPPRADAALVDDHFLDAQAVLERLVAALPLERLGRLAVLAEAHLLADDEGVAGALQGRRFSSLLKPVSMTITRRPSFHSFRSRLTR
jgi:hypothetical protein